MFTSFGASGRLGAVPSAALVSLLVLFVGCDPSVDVLEPSEEYQYSLFGTLDVAADTQKIRVESFEDPISVGATPSFPGRVQLKNMETGAQVTLHDSLVTVGADIRAHNFWTTHPIQPSTEYRVVVQVDGETVTSATTTTPDSSMSVRFGTGVRLPCVGQRNEFELSFEGAERVAAVQVTYPITLTQGSGADAHVYDSTRVRYDHLHETRDPFTIPVDYGSDLVNLNDEDPTTSRGTGCIPRDRFFHDYVWVTVADGGADWPDWLGVPLNELARPDSFSNVEGGHGYVGGIYSDTVKVPVRQRGPE